MTFTQINFWNMMPSSLQDRQQHEKQAVSVLIVQDLS